MAVDYSAVIDLFVDLLSISVPIALAVGLLERLVSFFLDSALDRISRKERI